MYFTLAVSAPDAATCEDLTQRGCAADPRALPVPGPARVAWRAPDGRSGFRFLVNEAGEDDVALRGAVERVAGAQDEALEARVVDDPDV